jgi:hypothetical protein
MACETCWKRKSKCDNARPSCGSCKDLEVECSWRDFKSDYSSLVFLPLSPILEADVAFAGQPRYDLASLEILERINYVADLLETQGESLSGLISGSSIPAAGSPFTTDARTGHHSLQLQPTPQSMQYCEDVFASDNTQGDAEILLESLEIAGRSSGNSEDVLDWPIFQGRHPRANIEALMFNPQSAAREAAQLTTQERSPRSSSFSVQLDPIRTSKPSRGVQEDDVMNLVNKFLRNVHIKNPVLEADDLKQKAKLIQENGFGWDATSCLVVRPLNL